MLAFINLVPDFYLLFVISPRFSLIYKSYSYYVSLYEILLVITPSRAQLLNGNDLLITNCFLFALSTI